MVLARSLSLIVGGALFLGCAQHAWHDCPDSVITAQARSINCPHGQSLARVCAPEEGGPCALRCVQPAHERGDDDDE
jgi:hypothetical protein